MLFHQSSNPFTYIQVQYHRELYANDRSLASDSVKEARIVNRNILFRHDFDDLLRYHSTSQSSDVVEFGPTSTSPVVTVRNAQSSHLR